MKSLFIFIVAFLIGAIAMGIYAQGGLGDLSNPAGMLGTQEQASPNDHISEENIHIYPNRVVIMLDDPQWAAFSDTNSMDPVLDAGHNAIEVVPKTMDEIEVGDIVSYIPSDGKGITIHRVIEKNKDKDGEYLIFKGDNNPVQDPEKVRFPQVQRMVVGIIY
jgi:hypothetical protein